MAQITKFARHKMNVQCVHSFRMVKKHYGFLEAVKPKSSLGQQNKQKLRAPSLKAFTEFGKTFALLSLIHLM